MVITKNLPTIKDIDVWNNYPKSLVRKIETVLWAHEQHAKEMIKISKKYEPLFCYWQGYEQAIRALKGKEVKE